MVRRPAFAAAWGLLLGACALDLNGLGAALPGDDGGARAPTQEDATADQSVGEPDGVEAGEEAGEMEAEGPEAQGSGDDGATSTADAVSPADAAAAGDAHAEAGSVCDEDGDGYLATGGCGGNDCCDTDAHVHPGQTSYFTKPGVCGGYDYNCDGKESPEYGATNCTWSTFSCSGDGFAAPVPACGAFGTFTSCSIPWYDPLTCNGSNAQQAQGCR
jgi:hypothetical protein